MKLNRSLIKSQAKQLIKGKVWRLFLTAFVITLCMSIVSSISSAVLEGYAQANGLNNDYSDSYDVNPFDDNENDYDSDYFNGFGNGEANDFFNFNGRIAPITISTRSAYNSLSSTLSSISSLATLLLGPLGVTLAIFFVWFIRGREYETGKGIELIFKETFNKSYLRKFLCFLLRDIITVALTACFIIPGIIFYYSSYFAFELLCDFPELSSWEAIKLSKKMIRGHRGELFAMDLSFIGWGLLCVFVFPVIYAMPYYMTTRALFYENFRLRALQIGELTEDDFLSEQQRFAKYSGNPGMGANQYAAPGAPANVNPYSTTTAQQFGMGGGVGAQPFGEQNQTAGGYTQQPNFAPPQGGYYQPPVQQPQAPFYQPPVSQPQPQAPQQPQGGFYVPPAPPAEPVQPTFTVSEPVAPQEPSYAEVIVPEEPVEAFTEPTEPTESFTEQTSPTDPTDIN